jgi:nickel/cobalt exporter
MTPKRLPVLSPGRASSVVAPGYPLGGFSPGHAAQPRRKSNESHHWTRLIAFLVGVAVLIGLLPHGADAHPADRLKQHLLVQLQPTQAQLSFAIGGGILANELVLAEIDPNGDGVADDAETAAWLAKYLGDVEVFVDDTAVPLDPGAATITVPKLDDFHLGLSPILVTANAPVPAASADTPHRLVVSNSYRIDRTDFGIDVESAAGTKLINQGWPGSTARITFSADPAMADVALNAATDAAKEWGKGGVINRAKRELERPKTPLFVLTLVAIFALMGALHAIQPGHGKTLVAGYLVATGGTPRDAMTLAGIVTFTHTASVFLLGFATIMASRFFLPSRVIPVLTLFSGLLIVLMGLNMVRNALRRGHDHSHVHHHDHAELSPEEHAQLHLAEVKTVVAGDQRKVSFRNLVTLGVSGGLAPCPDALAILLLAVGINQAAFGMVAILAFSLGLAGVLVAFGLSIALAGPFWKRASAALADRNAALSTGLGRFVAISPIMSAVFVLILGLGMVWRAGLGA